jgi:hypothetical protein
MAKGNNAIQGIWESFSIGSSTSGQAFFTFISCINYNLKNHIKSYYDVFKEVQPWEKKKRHMNNSYLVIFLE